MSDVHLILLILAATVAMFVWGRWRHDMVALGALLACVLAGLVRPEVAFAGFGHPAVITVACVLVLSRGLLTSGAVDAIARTLLPQEAGAFVTIAAITGLAAVLSAFMNNVGALALLLPVAMQLSARRQVPPGRILMPMAFGSILGGMTTLIGTPPNLIVSGFRAQAVGTSFGMFDFTPVGLAVAAIGVLFVALLGWRLVPARERVDAESFETGAYLTEARVPEKAAAVGMTLRRIEDVLDEVGAQTVALIRDGRRITAPSAARVVQGNDILVIEAEPEALAKALSSLGLKLEEAVEKLSAKGGKKGDDGKATASDEVVLMELSVMPNSPLIERSASDVHLRTRFGINLLAVSRQGRRSTARLRTMRIHAGDVLLMQGEPASLAEFAGDYTCVPLAERGVRLPNRRQAIAAGAIMALAVGGAAFGLVPAAISLPWGCWRPWPCGWCRRGRSTTRSTGRWWCCSAPSSRWPAPWRRPGRPTRSHGCCSRASPAAMPSSPWCWCWW